MSSERNFIFANKNNDERRVRRKTVAVNEEITTQTEIPYSSNKQMKVTPPQELLIMFVIRATNLDI